MLKIFEEQYSSKESSALRRKKAITAWGKQMLPHLFIQSRRMMTNVVFNKASDKVVTVVITFLEAQG